MLRQGIVVGVNPQDHSVDIVMLDDGSRVVGAQVLTPNGSARTGTFDMPAVPKRKKKWDISERTDQDQIAMVGYVGRNPVVVGFLYPQVNQITRKSDKVMTYRHQSDVEVQIGEKGAISIRHPGGFSLEVGTPDASGLEPDGEFDRKAITRNASENNDFRIRLGGGAILDFSVDKEGQLSITVPKGMNFKCAEKFVVEAQGGMEFKTPQLTVVDGNVTVADGSVEVSSGSVTVPSGDVVASSISLVMHVHTDVTPGPSLTGPPSGS